MGCGRVSVTEEMDRVFSAQVLGSIWLGTTAGKIVEKILNLIYTDTSGLLVGWTVAFILSIFLIVYWSRIEAKVDEYVWEKL